MVFASMFEKSMEKREKKKNQNCGKNNKRKTQEKSLKNELSRDHVSGKPSASKRPRIEKVRPERSQPSREALQLSARLKELSSQKRLQQAVSLYQDKANDKIRDSHHACSVIDCAARCGSISTGEKVFADMKKKKYANYY